MGRVSQWAVRRPWYALLTWIAMMVVLGFLGVRFGGDYNDNFELPDTESTTAQELLADIAGGGAGTGAGLEGQVVWSPESGTTTDPAAKAAMTALLVELSESPGVSCVLTPFGDPLGEGCPEPPAAEGGADQQSQDGQPADGQASDEQPADGQPADGQPADGQASDEQPADEQPADGQASDGGAAPAEEQPELSPEAEGALAHFAQSGTSPDETVAFATVMFEGASFDDLDTDDVLVALNLIKAQNGQDGLVVGANGVFGFVGGEPPSSEAIGVTVALVILLFAFGSVLGAFLPIVSALLSVALTTGFVLPLVARYFDVATFAPILASMIGLGVGIDYSLFVINRYREALIHGRTPRDAALESVRTSGRAVQFAAATVIIALLGLFVMRITFFNGIAVSSAITVLMVMIGALLLLPAVLSLLGTWAFVGRMAWISDEEAVPTQRLGGLRHAVGRFFRYLGWLVYLPVTLVGLAWRWIAHRGRVPDLHRPNMFARYGNWLQKRPWLTAAFALIVMLVFAIPMLSLRLGFSDDSGTPEGSPARIAYDLTAEGFGAGVNGPFYIAVELPAAGDQEALTALSDALGEDPGVALAAAAPVGEDATVAVIQVIPKTAPQDEETTDLLFRLREDVIPAATAGSGAQAYVGGFQAVTVDFTQVLSDALPWFLLIVVGMGFLAMVVLFRSVLVAATGAISSLLSLGAALGVTVAVFQWGWSAELVNLQATGPVFPFLPVMVFAILFGLSCDYQVFLVSRMHEEWVNTSDNRRAVRRGLAGSGRVVAIAAAIMTSVFGAFVLGDDAIIKLFGVSLSAAVLLDAFVVRLILIPSLMTIFGPANWWLPAWLGRLLPHISVESEEDIHAGAAEIEDIEELTGETTPRPV